MKFLTEENWPALRDELNTAFSMGESQHPMNDSPMDIKLLRSAIIKNFLLTTEVNIKQGVL